MCEIVDVRNFAEQGIIETIVLLTVLEVPVALEDLRNAAGAAAPRGLQQQQQAEVQGGGLAGLREAAGPQSRQPNWSTGGQFGSTENGWNTPFQKEMQRQQDEELKKGTLNDWYKRSDFTGVALYDAHGKSFGRVYENGQDKGSIYDQMSRAEANQVLAPYMLDAKTMQQANSPEKLEAEIERKKGTIQSELDKGAGAAAFEQRTQSRLSQWDVDSTVADEAITVGGGAAGGALVGAGIGSILPGAGTAIGAGIGAVAGALGAWLNRDELIEQAARTSVQFELANEQTNGVASAGYLLAGVSGLGAKALSPLGNLTHGLYETTQGGVGDGVSDWYATDNEGNNQRGWGWDVAGYAAMLPDAVGSFGTKAAMRAFQITMGGSVIGQTTGMVASGGQTFDDSRGGYDNVFVDDEGNFNALSGAAGVGAIAVDALQLGGVSGIMRAAKDQFKIFGGRGATKAGDVVEMGGYRYTLDEAGNAVNRRMGLSMLAPSEMLQGASVNMLARVRNRAIAEGKPGADDYYRQAIAFTNGASPRSAFFVNAAGEGYEEAIQAVLDPISHDSQVDWKQVGESFIAGAAMGGGMSIAATRNGMKLDQRMRAQADEAALRSGRGKYSNEEWAALSTTEKAARVARAPEESAALKAALTSFKEEQEVSVVADYAAPRVRYAATLLAEQTRELQNAAPRTDESFRITSAADPEKPGYAVHSSLKTVQDLLSRSWSGIELAMNNTADPVEQAQLAEVLTHATTLRAFLDNKQIQYAAALSDADRESLVAETNAFIRSWFDGADREGLTPEQITARAQAATVMFARHPLDNAGSFQALMPQAEPQLTRHGNNASVQVGYDILEPLGGDFDGDKLQQMARLIVNPEQYKAMRQGVGYQSVEGDIQIPAMPYEKWESQRLGAASLQAPGTAAHSASVVAKEQISRRLTARYGHIPGFAPYLETFLQELSAGMEDARENFQNALSKNLSAQINEVDPNGLTHEWMEIRRIVVQELQRFQAAIAAKVPVKGQLKTNAAPTRINTEAFTRLQADAQVEGLSLANASSGSEMFRIAQFGKYTVDRVTLVGSDIATNNPDMQAQVDAFLMLDEGILANRDQIEQSQASSHVAARAQERIRLAAIAMTQETGFNVSPVALANQLVVNMDSKGIFHSDLAKGDSQNISFAQAMLREEIMRERQDYGPRLEALPEIEQQLNMLERLTRPNREKQGSRKVAYAGLALAEVYGETPLYYLDTEAGGSIGLNLTLGQWIRQLVAMSPARRTEEIRQLQGDPRYLGRKQKNTNLPYHPNEIVTGEITSFRSIVDAAAEAVNHTLSMVRDGDNAGSPTGDMAERDKTVRKNVQKVIAALNAAIQTYAGYENVQANADGVRKLLEENPQFAEDVFNAFVNDKTARSFFRVTGDDQGTANLMMSNWLVEALAMEPAAGEFHLLKNIIRATWNSASMASSKDDKTKYLRKFDKLDDRYHQLMALLGDLNDGGYMLERFLIDMDTAKDTATFVKIVNTKYAPLFDLPPFLGWIRDVAEIDPDRTAASANQQLDGAEERAAIATLRTRAEQLLQSTQATRLARQSDLATLKQLRSARNQARAGTLKPGTSDALAREDLLRAIRLANKNLNLMSPADRALANMRQYELTYQSAAAKGKSTLPMLGSFDSILGEFGTPYEQTKASLMSRSVDVVATHPNIAASGALTIMDNDGVPVVFDGLTEDFILDNWTNPMAQEFIRGILFPSVSESTADGRGQIQKFLVEPSLANLINQKEMFKQILDERNPEIYSSYIEGIALSNGARHSVSDVLLDLMGAQMNSFTRTSTTNPEDEASTQRLYAATERGLMNLYKQVGDLAALRVEDIDAAGKRVLVPAVVNVDGQLVDALEHAGNLVKKKLRESFLRKAFRLSPEAEFNDDTRDLLEAELSSFRAKALAQFQATDERDALEAAAKQSQLLDTLLNGDIVDTAIELFGYEEGMANSAAQRKMLYGIARSNPHLENRAPWARDAFMLAKGLESGIAFADEDNLPIMSADNWNLIGRAVIADFLEDMSGVKSANELKLPVFPDYRKAAKDPSIAQALAYWDPSRVRIVEGLFDRANPNVRAAEEIFEASGNVHRASVDSLVRTFENSFIQGAPEGMPFKAHFGPWTVDEVRAGVENDSRVRSSGSETGIQMGGLAPKKEWWLSARWRRTFDHPDVSQTSVMSLSAQELLKGSAFSHGATTLHPSGETTSHEPLAMLNGRFAADVRVTGPDGQEVSIWAGTPTSPPLGEAWLRGGAPHPELRAVTLERLRRGVQGYLRDNNLDESSVQVSIQYLHPDTRPAEGWYGNVYYDGLATEVANSDSYSSLNSTMWIAPGGLNRLVQQWALQAQKKGTQGLQLATTFDASQRAVLHSGWENNLSSVLHRLAIQLMEAQDGDKAIPEVFYNSILHQVRRGLFVRGRDVTTGEAVLWTADEVIARQMEDPAWDITQSLEIAELYVPSETVLRTLYGDSREYSSGANFDMVPQVDYSDVATFEGKFSPRELATIAGGLTIDPETQTWLKRDILDTAVAQRRPKGVYKSRRGMTDKELALHTRLPVERAAQRAEIYQERAATKMDWKDVSNKNSNQVAESFSESAASMRFVDEGIPVPDRPASLNFAERDIERDMARTVAGSQYRMTWDISGRDVQKDPQDGMQTPDTLRNASKLGPFVIAPSDIANVNVDSFLQTDGNLDLELAKEVLRELVKRGAVINLYSKTKANNAMDELAAHLRTVPTYNPMTGSNRMFEEDLNMSGYANARSRYSSLTAMEDINFGNMALSLVEYSLDIGENTAIAVEAGNDLSGDVIQTVNLLPVIPFKDFSYPVEPRLVERVKQSVLQMLDDPAQQKFLAKQAGVTAGESQTEWDLSLEELRERWENNTETDGILPHGMLRRGSIIPLVRQRGSKVDIVLYRHGHETLTVEDRDKQFEAAAAYDSPVSLNIASYSSEERGTDATVHEGEIVGIRHRAKFGLEVSLRIPLTALGGKQQANFAGFKVVLSTWTKEKAPMPAARLFANRGVDYLVSADDERSKNSFEGTVTSYRDAFGLLGIDFLPELTEFYTGKAPGDVGYPAAVTATRDYLTRLSTDLPRYSDQVLRHASETGKMPGNLAADVTALGFDGVRADWVSELQAMTEKMDEQVQTAGTAERQQALAGIAFATTLYLSASVRRDAKTPLYLHTLQSTGIAAIADRSRYGDARGQKMPPLFTETLDMLPVGHPTKRLLTQKLNEGFGEGYSMDENFIVRIDPEDGPPRFARLKAIQMFSSGDATNLDEMAQGRGDRQNVSLTTQTLSNMALDGYISFDRPLVKTAALRASEGVNTLATEADVWQLMNDVEVPKVHRTNRNYRNPAQSMYVRLAEEVGGDFRQLIDFELHKDKYSKAEFKKKTEEFNAGLTKIMNHLNMRPGQERYVHYWIRQQLGKKRPTHEDEPEISFGQAIEALGEISFNIERGMLPTVDGDVPMMHYSDLTMLFTAAKDGKGLALKGSERAGDYLEPTDWEGWVNVALAFGETKGTVFDALFLTATDHMLHSYLDKEDSLLNLPVSRDELRAAKLWDPVTNELAYSLAPDQARSMDEPIILDRQYADFGNMFGSVRIGKRWYGKLPPASHTSKIRQARRRWRKDGHIAAPVMMRMSDFRQYGRQLKEAESTTNAITRMALDLRAGTALLNPTLWVSAIFEMAQRLIVDVVTNLLLGEKVGGLGRIESVLGTSTYSAEQQTLLRNLVSGLGSRNEFKGMLYRDLMFKQEKPGHNPFERATRGLARWGSFMQDPTWGMRGSALARRYVESVLQYLAANPTETVISLENVAGRLMNDPSWVADNIPAAHDAALATIANVRSLKNSPASLGLRGVIDPLSKNPNFAANFLGNWVGKMPFMFFNYASNVVINNAGLQGASAFLATQLHGRENPFAGIQSWLAGDGYQKDTGATFDMSTVLEGLDLSKAFMQGAVTHTGLFALGMLAGTLGLDGDDEEERRRKKAAQYQRGFLANDPRNIVNDWRNADALYLDWLPFGLGTMFHVPDPEGTNSARSMADMHWVMRQFVSPVLGMQRFFDTGDMRHIIWGFEDAIGSMPLVNTMTWDDANRTVARLSAAAPDDTAEESIETALDAYGFGIKILATYESMLFESSFINQLKVNLDKYDRDPWALPERDNDGTILRDRLNVPQTTKALDDFVDPTTGDIRLGTANRDWWDATIHGFAENRATLATLMSIFTGLGDSSFQRDNMVAKTRKIEKDAMTDDQAASLVVGLYANETGADNQFLADIDSSYLLSGLDAMGRETLNDAGAEAVIRGIWKQSVTLGAPSLEGVFIPFEMRERLQANLMNAIIQEGVDAGLSEYDAKGRMYDIWHGPQDNPEVKGLKEIVWSDQLSYVSSERYYQLNTTYITGPDGRIHATGLSRTGLHNAFGFAPLQGFYNGDVGQPVDGRLNAVDAATGVNTGMRGLEKADESWIKPSDEEIAESIVKGVEAAMKKVFEADDSKGGYGKSGSGYGRSGGGGGGGGGGYSFKLQSPERNNPIYSANDPYIRVDDPILRRATVRRERYSSTRGRLTQWQ